MDIFCFQFPEKRITGVDSVHKEFSVGICFMCFVL